MIKLNSVNLILLIALIALPIAGLILHLKLHPNYIFLTYILLFDIVIITLLYLFKKSIFYAFILNTVFFLVGVIMHIIYVTNPISDILLSIPDFGIGYVLWKLNKDIEVRSTGKIKSIKTKKK